MKRILVIVAVALVALLVAAGVGLWAWSGSRHAAPAPEALAALADDGSVIVDEGDFLVFRPAAAEPTLGVVFYPGASSDLRGYAPVLRRIAAAGYLVVAVPMPLEFAFLAPDRALDAQAAHPEIERWAIIGHSLGGAMAAGFVHRHPEKVQGLIIWDSYPPPNSSLAEYPRPVWHIHRATANGMPPPAFSANRYLYPAGSRWVPIPGGIHMFFGSFVGGGYKEDWTPLITREEHQDRAVAATLEALAGMAATT